MRTILLLLVVFGCFLSSVDTSASPVTNPPPKYPGFTLPNTQLRTLPRAAGGPGYLLYIALPASYHANPLRKYPVLYATDGYYRFTGLYGLYDQLVKDRVVPEFIIVGIGYAGENQDYRFLRRRDLGPAPVEGTPGSGHAAEFLGSLEQEIIPFVENNYRTDPTHRVLSGISFGGTFSLFTMLTKPELFSGYIAVSPDVSWNPDWMFEYEAAFAKSGRKINARLFMTTAENEGPKYIASIRRFDERLKLHAYSGLEYRFRFIDDERHFSTFAEATNRGLRFVFEPLAPETGPTRD